MRLATGSVVRGLVCALTVGLMGVLSTSCASGDKAQGEEMAMDEEASEEAPADTKGKKGKKGKAKKAKGKKKK